MSNALPLLIKRLTSPSLGLRLSKAELCLSLASIKPLVTKLSAVNHARHLVDNAAVGLVEEATCNFYTTLARTRQLAFHFTPVELPMVASGLEAIMLCRRKHLRSFADVFDLFLLRTWQLRDELSVEALASVIACVLNSTESIGGCVSQTLEDLMEHTLARAEAKDGGVLHSSEGRSNRTSRIGLLRLLRIKAMRDGCITEASTRVLIDVVTLEDAAQLDGPRSDSIFRSWQTEELNELAEILRYKFSGDAASGKAASEQIQRALFTDSASKMQEILEEVVPSQTLVSFLHLRPQELGEELASQRPLAEYAYDPVSLQRLQAFPEVCARLTFLDAMDWALVEQERIALDLIDLLINAKIVDAASGGIAELPQELLILAFKELCSHPVPPRLLPTVVQVVQTIQESNEDEELLIVSKVLSSGAAELASISRENATDQQQQQLGAVDDGSGGIDLSVALGCILESRVVAMCQETIDQLSQSSSSQPPHKDQDPGTRQTLTIEDIEVLLSAVRTPNSARYLLHALRQALLCGGPDDATAEAKERIALLTTNASAIFQAAERCRVHDTRLLYRIAEAVDVTQLSRHAVTELLSSNAIAPFQAFRDRLSKQLEALHAASSSAGTSSAIQHTTLPQHLLHVAQQGEKIPEALLDEVRSNLHTFEGVDLAYIVAALALVKAKAHTPVLRIAIPQLLPQVPELPVFVISLLFRAMAHSKLCRNAMYRAVCNRALRLAPVTADISELLAAFCVLEVEHRELMNLMATQAAQMMHGRENVLRVCFVLQQVHAARPRPEYLCATAAAYFNKHLADLTLEESVAVLRALALHDHADNALIDPLLDKIEQQLILQQQEGEGAASGEERNTKLSVADCLTLLDAAVVFNLPDLNAVAAQVVQYATSAPGVLDAMSVTERLTLAIHVLRIAQTAAAITTTATAAASNAAASNTAEIGGGSDSETAKKEADEKRSDALSAQLDALVDSVVVAPLHEQLGTFSEKELATYCQVLKKQHDIFGAVPSESNAAEREELAHNAVNLAADLIQQGVPVSGSCLVDVVDLASGLAEPPIQALNDITEWLAEVVDSLSCKQLKQLFSAAAASMELFQGRGCWVPMAEKLASFIGTYTSKEVCEAVHVLAKSGLDHSHPIQNALQLIADHAVDHAIQFTDGRSIVRMLYDLSRMGHKQRNVYHVFGRQLYFRPIVHALRRQDVTLAFAAFAEVKYLDPVVFNKLARKVRYNSDELNAMDVALTVKAHSQVYVLDERLYDRLADRACDIAADFPTQASIMMLEGFANVGVQEQEATERILEYLLPQLESVSVQQSVLLLKSLCMLDHTDPEHYDTIAENICNKVEDATPEDIADICRVMQSTQYRHDKLLHRIGDHATQLGSAGEFDAPTARLLLDTHALFLVHHADVREALSDMARSVSKEFIALDEGSDTSSGVAQIES